MPINSNCFWIFIGAALAAIPLPLIKLYNNTKNIGYMIISIIFYIALIFVYSLILKSYDMSKIYPCLKILSILIVIIAGVFMFNEKMTTKHIIGIIFALVGIYLLTF